MDFFYRCLFRLLFSWITTQISTGMGVNILGDAFMKNMLVEFDRQNQRVRCGSVATSR